MLIKLIAKIKDLFKESKTKDISIESEIEDVNPLETIVANEVVEGTALKDLEIGKHYLMLTISRKYNDEPDMESNRIFVSGKGNYYPVNMMGYIIKPIIYPEIYYYEVNSSKYKSYKGYVQRPDVNGNGKLRGGGESLSQYTLDQDRDRGEYTIFLEEGQPNTKELASKFFMNKINEYMSKYKNKQDEEYLSTQQELLDKISKDISKM